MLLGGMLQKTVNCPAELLAVLAKDKEEVVRELVASNPNCSVELLEVLAHDKDSSVLKAVARNPNCPQDLCIRLLEVLFKYKKERIWVPINRNCPVFLLEVLAKDEERWARRNVADNPNCPVELLELLAKDKDKFVCYGVACNPNCPVSLLEALVKDNNHRAKAKGKPKRGKSLRVLFQHIDLDAASDAERNAVIIKAHLDFNYTDIEISDFLKIRHQSVKKVIDVVSQESIVRELVAGNPNCPVSLLEVLARDDWGVRRGVAENLNCPLELLTALAKDKEEVVLRSVASNPNCPVELLKALADDEEAMPRSLVADNPNCPVELLEALVEDKEEYVLRSVASNPNCPVELLEVLAKDEDALIRLLVAGHSNCPQDLCIRLLDALSKNKEEAVRLSVVEHPNCSVSLLESLAKDADKIVRKYVAGNPNCPVEIMKALLEEEGYTAALKTVTLQGNQEPVYQTIQDKPIPVWFKQFTDRFSLPDLSNLNDSRQRGLFVPGFKKKIETSDEILGVLGGYFYRSPDGDQNIKDRMAPILQLNLAQFSNACKFDFGKGLLEVWREDSACEDGFEMVDARGTWYEAQSSVQQESKYNIPEDLSFTPLEADPTDDVEGLEAFNSAYDDLNIKPPLFMVELTYLGPSCYTTANQPFWKDVASSDISALRDMPPGDVIIGSEDPGLWDLRYDQGLVPDIYDEMDWEDDSFPWIPVIRLPDPHRDPEYRDNWDYANYWSVFFNTETREFKVYHELYWMP